MVWTTHRLQQVLYSLEQRFDIVPVLVEPEDAVLLVFVGPPTEVELTGLGDGVLTPPVYRSRPWRVKDDEDDKDDHLHDAEH